MNRSSLPAFALFRTTGAKSKDFRCSSAPYWRAHSSHVFWKTSEAWSVFLTWKSFRVRS